MYKTAIITDEVSQDLTVAAELARRYRLDALEIRSVNERNPFQMTQEDAEYIHRTAQQYGLEICAVGSPLFKCPLDDEKTRGEHMEAFRRVLGFMALWGAKMIRGFTFFNMHDGGKRMDEVLAHYQPIIALAQDAGVTVVIESEPSVYTPDIQSLVAFLRQLDSPWVQGLYDPGNEVANASGLPPYPDGYNLLKPYLRHVHIKDILMENGAFKPAMLGEGSVDFHGVFEALRRDFCGYVSVETHYRVKAAVSEHDLLHPQGSSFSEGGYEASIRYLDALDQQYHWKG